MELDDFLSGGGLEPIGAAARTTAVGWLVDSVCSAESAAAAVGRLDEALPRVTGLRSASDAFGYLDARFGQLADTSTADLQTPYQNPECLLVLILSSLFLAMLQYYPQTANPLHLPPTSLGAIGRQDQANHQYDLSAFWSAADAGNLPAVSFLKAPRAEDAHSGNSDPLDEQQFLVSTINRLESLPTWSSTAVIIAYDDSNGWYDHQSGPLVTQSQTPFDQLTGSGTCGTNATAVPVSDSDATEQGRCGLGPRLPLLVISPWARVNYVDHALTDQSSIIRFIEDNWHLSRLGNGSAEATAGSIMSMFDFRPAHHHQDPRLYLDPATGQSLS